MTMHTACISPNLEIISKKKCEHIPQHCYISHNHPYISSSRATATYVGMVVE